MAELLRFEAVTLHNMEGRMVFQELDWSLPAGGRVQVQAAAGIGASALLRLAAGLAHPQAGRVILEGVPLGPYTFDHPFLKRGGLGWVPTEGGLLANLNLRANVALPLRFLRGHSQPRAEAMAQEHLDQAGLGAQADLRPHAVEPRERWLAALVRAFVTDPSLWLLDQPPGKLEARERQSAEHFLFQAAKNADTAFLIAGSKGWKGLTGQEFHLEQGRIVPGGL
jgi:predicted ABC-type transport system involved in lysophospholipase L1 biosynthesis ATPase subunit